MLTQFKYSAAFESMSQLHYPTKEGNLPTSTILTDNRFNSSNQNQDLTEKGTSEVTTIVIAVSVCIGFIVIVVVAVIVIKRRRRESRQLGQHESFPLSDNRYISEDFVSKEPKKTKTEQTQNDSNSRRLKRV